MTRIALAVWLALPGALTAAPPNFAKEVAPILEQHCIRCHHPGNRKGELSLTTMSDLKESGQVVPGKPDESPLLKLVTPKAGSTRARMPKEGKPLTAAEVAVLRRWIAEGATWPEGAVLREKAKADGTWWSLQPLGKAEPLAPPGLPADWANHAIDRFVFARLAEKGLRPSPPADRLTLIRRLTYDLTGLPPSPSEIEKFLHDNAPDAYEKLVDRLLASPQYGEQWGRHWLDVVRFGESNGYERNVLINNVWPFRDYVIRSLNEDRPFDQLILEHLAGDVVARGKPDREIGTAFLVCGPYDNVGNGDPAQAALIRANHLDEIIRATAESFLGLTLGCARCHDHKFDPITQRDYYSLYATFAGVRHADRPIVSKDERETQQAQLEKLKKQRDQLGKERDDLLQVIRRRDAQPTAAEEARLGELKTELDKLNQAIAAAPPLPRVWAGTFDADAGKRPYHLFLGGDPQKKGAAVTPASLSVLAGLPSRYELPATASETDRRLALAKWIIGADNPLTPRVLANRLWHYHFGTGIVDTPSDFGWMGSRPSHPELLDWLARQVDVHGWKLKPLHRLIVTSQTYRQASTWSDAAAKADADSRLLWRFPPRRLTGEEVRDTMLTAAAKLDRSKMGGPGFRLYRYVEDNVATYHPLDRHGPETYRRAVYHQNARAARVDLLSDFDCPDPAAAAPRRASTTTPLQALALLNHRFTHDMAQFASARVEKEAGTRSADQVRLAFVLAYGRPPDAEELERCVPVVEKHGLRTLWRALLNSSELIYLR
ncbi:MAG: DUF1553 domain-containing protein [Gemmataceae bacterium]|nr:DUF1553 domain-containing protein [Gemmataceae bacterium]